MRNKNIMPDNSNSPLRKPRSAAGFTMIELLIAIALLLVGIVAVAKLVPVAVESNFRNRNDSTALIVAQRELDQMAEQALTATNSGACTGAAPAGHYYFCDSDWQIIALGDIDTSGGASVTTEAGCPLTANGQLDFTQPVGSCDAGYTVNKQWSWNPVTGTNRDIELRWRVISWHVNNAPVRKVIIMGARGGIDQQTMVVTNLQTVVGR